MQGKVIICWIFLSVNFFYATQAIAQNTLYRERKGYVTDTLGRAIVGASVLLIDVNKLLRTDHMGYFPIPMTSASVRIRITTLGFASIQHTIEPSSINDTLQFILKILPIKMQQIDVISDISIEDIMNRIIAKTKNYDFTTASISIYTKAQLQSTTIRQTISQGARLHENISLIESWQNIYQITNENKSSYHTVIRDIQFSPNTDPRIAAASILPLQSFNLFENEITLLATQIISPISLKGRVWYQYTMQPSNDPEIYQIAFRPKQVFAPGLVGTMSVRASSYNVLHTQFSLSKQTSIPYLDSLIVEQDYREYVVDSVKKKYVQMPNVTQYCMGISFKILPFFEGAFHLKGLASVDSVIFNKSISFILKNTSSLDSVSTLLWKIPQGKTVALTESRLLTFPIFDLNAKNPAINRFRAIPLSQYEISLYTHSALWKPPVVEQATSKLFTPGDVASINWSNPYSLRELFPLNTIFTFRPREEDTTWLIGTNIIGIRSRTTNIGIGPEIALQWQKSVTLRAGFIVNATPIFYNAGLEWSITQWNQGSVSISGSIFSKIRSIQPRRWDDEMFAPRFGLNVDYLAFSSWYDFYRETGYGLEARYINGPLHITLGAQQSRQEQMLTIATIDNDTRPNIAVNNGNFYSLKTSLAWNYWQPTNIAIYTLRKPHCGVRLSALYGMENKQLSPYYKFDGSLYLMLPTFETDYVPMYGEFILSGGWASEQAPLQEYFFMQKRYLINGHTADFFSVPVISFGGNQFLSLRTEHNFSDILWRALGLPTYKGRGLEFIAHGGIARYDHTIKPPISDQQLFAANLAWYMEAGFGVGRIPTIIFDMLTLRFDAAWGLGQQGAGKFGWSLSAQFNL